MKHSKLPWKTVSQYTVNLSMGDVKVIALQDDTGRTVAITVPTLTSIEQHENAEFIVTACNEHDTLKAKAELLDDLLAIAEMAQSFCEEHIKIGPNPSAVNALLRINEILSKAKELK